MHHDLSIFYREAPQLCCAHFHQAISNCYNECGNSHTKRRKRSNRVLVVEGRNQRMENDNKHIIKSHLRNGVQPRFPKSGYMVDFLELSSATIAALIAKAEQAEYIPDFKQVSGKEDDKFRLQARVKRLKPALCDVSMSRRDIASVIDHNYRPQIFSFMQSRPGRDEQGPHNDYPREDLARVSGRYPGSVRESMILALQSGTKLKVFVGCLDELITSTERQVTIPVGHCILFRGDLAHRGAKHDATNYRVHCDMIFDKTPWVPDTVQSTQPPAFECGFAPTLRRRRHRSPNTSTTATRTPKYQSTRRSVSDFRALRAGSGARCVTSFTRRKVATAAMSTLRMEPLPESKDNGRIFSLNTCHSGVNIDQSAVKLKHDNVEVALKVSFYISFTAKQSAPP